MLDENKNEDLTCQIKHFKGSRLLFNEKNETQIHDFPSPLSLKQFLGDESNSQRMNDACQKLKNILDEMTENKKRDGLVKSRSNHKGLVGENGFHLDVKRNVGKEIHPLHKKRFVQKFLNMRKKKL